MLFPDSASTSTKKPLNLLSVCICLMSMGVWYGEGWPGLTSFAIGISDLSNRRTTSGVACPMEGA